MASALLTRAPKTRVASLGLRACWVTPRRGYMEAVVLDPQLVCDRKSLNVVLSKEVKKGSSAGAAVRVRLPWHVVELMRRGEGVEDSGDPGRPNPTSAWSFGRRDEISRYKFVGAHLTDSGLTSVLPVSALHDLARGAGLLDASWDEGEQALTDSKHDVGGGSARNPLGDARARSNVATNDFARAGARAGARGPAAEVGSCASPGARVPTAGRAAAAHEEFVTLKEAARMLRDEGAGAPAPGWAAEGGRGCPSPGPGLASRLHTSAVPGLVAGTAPAFFGRSLASLGPDTAHDSSPPGVAVPSWDELLAAVDDGKQGDQLPGPFLFAGRLVGCYTAGVHVLPGDGDEGGLLISSVYDPLF